MTSIDSVALAGKASVPHCRRCPPREGTFCAGARGELGRRLMAARGQVRVVANATIFREGEPARYLFVVGAGAVKLYKLLPDGRRQVTGFLFQGDLFGLTSGSGYAYTAEAMGPALLCRFSQARLDALRGDNPGLDRCLLTAVSRELAFAHEQMLLLGRKTARERMASFLMSLHRNRPAGGMAPMDLPMSRTDIADFLGLTVETVSRMLTRFRREGLIALPDAGHVALIEPDRLAAIADGTG